MAVNLKGKKTSLDEKASIYKKRDENESEKSKWSRMTKQEKITHFKTYYLRPVILGIIIIGIIGFFVYRDVVMKKDLVYRCAVLNESAMDMPLVEFEENFVEYLGLSPEKNISSFQLYYTNSELAAQVGASVSNELTQLSSLIYATSLDSIIASEEDYKNYLEKGFFMDLEDILSEQELAVLQPYLYVPDMEENKEGHAFGVYLDSSEVYQTLFQDGGGIVEKPILGIIFNSTRKETSRQLLYYLFPELQNVGNEAK